MKTLPTTVILVQRNVNHHSFIYFHVVLFSVGSPEMFCLSLIVLPAKYSTYVNVVVALFFTYVYYTCLYEFYEFCLDDDELR